MKVSENILTRRVANVLPTRAGLEKLMGERKIKLYQGFDPTGTRLHLGHSIGLRKLMEFAEAGHEVIFLFGTGTVLAGDPSQREEARARIAAEQIEHNIADWKNQVKAIVDFNKVSVMYNGEWLLKLNLRDIIEIASNISAVQLFKRDMFQKRIDKGDTVWMHETLYPLLQGYDSVAMDVDLEIGGTDQEFNMLIGRDLVKKMKNKEKYVLTVPMILGTDGKQMSKSSGNCVWLNDTPRDMYAKLLQVPDDQIVTYMDLVTNLESGRVSEVEKGLKSGSIHPLDAKKELAISVVSELHSPEDAQTAKSEFESTFNKGETPENIPIYAVSGGSINLTDVLTETGLSQSRSDARRLIEQGGIEWNGEKVKEENLSVESSGTLRVGKFRFLKLEK